MALLKSTTVTAALKKAGFRKGVCTRSSQIRGWGTWTEGFESEQHEAMVVVSYHFPLFTDKADRNRKTALCRMALACRSAGWTAEISGDVCVVSLPETAEGATDVQA